MARCFFPLMLVFLTAEFARAAEAPVTLAGQIVPLKGKVQGVALKTDTELLTLADSPAARLLTEETTLHGRPVELVVKRTKGTDTVEAVRVFTVVKGKRHEVYYWCVNCQLRADEPGPCKCCGGETALVEMPVPVKK